MSQLHLPARQLPDGKSEKTLVMMTITGLRRGRQADRCKTDVMQDLERYGKIVSP